MRPEMSSKIASQVDEFGFSEPTRFLNSSECDAIMRYEASRTGGRGVIWSKGRAAAEPFYARLAADPRFINVLRPMLGEDVILWGVGFLKRPPGAVHPWHCDIESCAPEGGFVSVWIGIDNVSRETSLNCITRSHRFGRPVQQVAHQKGFRRGEADAQTVLSWANEFDRSAELVRPDMGNGEAIFFDGRLWHGTHNTGQHGVRTALLLQYASASREVRMIDFKKLEWPFQYIASPRPPVLVVCGRGDPSKNRVVEAPT
jgi:hypothetical protein